MITAYWWQGKPVNFGDELTPILLKRIYGLETSHSPAGSADLISTGSILEGVWSDKVSNRERPIQVVGSGFIRDGNPLPPQLGAHFHSVRGFLSKNRIEMGGDVGEISVGDPGLLVPFAANANQPVPRRRRFGVVLHYLKAGNSGIKSSLENLLGDVRFIDIRTTDIDNFVSEMQACEVILSHSLHGLIIADALGIPNAWLDLGGLYGKGFKFLDYFSTVGRAYYKKIEGLPDSLKSVADAIVEPPNSRIASLQDDVRQAFARAISTIEGNDSLEFSDKRMMSAITARSKVPWKSSSVVHERLFEFVSRSDETFRVNLDHGHLKLYRFDAQGTAKAGEEGDAANNWDVVYESTRSYRPQQLAIESAGRLSAAFKEATSNPTKPR